MLCDRLKVAIVLLAIGIVLGKFDFIIIFSFLGRSKRPSDNFTRVFFFGPSSAQVNHRFALSVSKFIQQLIKFVV